MANKELRLGTIFQGRIDPSFHRATTQLRTTLDSLNRAMGGATTAANRSASAQTKAAAAHTKAGTAAKKQATQSTFLNKQIRSIHGVYGQLMGAMKVTASYSIAGAAIFGLVNAFQQGIGEIINFDQSLKNLQAITGATDAQVSLMGETIKDVARTTKFSTVEVANGMTLLGQAGFDASESIAAMQATADLATGTMSDMVTTTDLMTTTIRAFDMQAVEAGRVADVMANAINKSKLTIEKLRIAFNFVGASAKQAGLSLEETAGSMMLLANNGLRASTIGTGLRQVMARLLAPNKKLRQAFEEHNIALSKVNPSVVGWTQALETLTPVLFDHQKNVVDMGKAYQLFGLRGAQAAAVLIKGFMNGDYQEMIEKTKATGTAATMAAKQAQGLAIEWKNLADRLKLVAIALGESGVTGALHLLVGALKTMATWLENLAGSTIGKLILQVTLLTSALLVLKTVFIAVVGKIAGGAILLAAKQFGIVLSSVWALEAGLKGLIAWFAGLLTVTNAVIAAFVGAVLVIYNLANANKRAYEESQKLATETLKSADALKSFREILESLETKTDQYENTLKRFILEHPELVRRIYELTGAVDITTLSFEALNTAMKKLELDDRETTLKKLSDGFEYQAKRVEATAKNVDRVREAFNKHAVTIGVYNATLQKAGVAKEKLNDMIRDSIRLNLEQVSTGRKTIDQVTEWINELVRAVPEMKKYADTMKETAIKEHKRAIETAEAAKNKVREFVGTLPKSYEEYYNKLDILRQADFAKVLENIEKEKAAYEKRAKVLGHTDEQRLAAKAAIEARALAEFEAENTKEYETVAENENRKIESYEKTAKLAVKVWKKQTLNLRKEYEERIDAAKGNAKKIEELNKELTVKLKQAEKERSAAVIGALIQTNKSYLTAMKSTYEEAIKLAESSVSSLESSLKSTKNELKKTLDDIEKFRADNKEKIRKLKQKEMTDEQKWNDDRKEAERLLSAGILNSNQSMVEKSISLFESLSRVVKDSNGEVLKSEKETTQTAIEGIERAGAASEDLFRKKAQSLTEDVRTIEKALLLFSGKIDDLKNSLNSLAEGVKIEIDISVAQKKIEAMQKFVKALKGDVNDKEDLDLLIDTLQSTKNIEAVQKPLERMKIKIEEIDGVTVLTNFRSTGSDEMGTVDKLIQIRQKAQEVLDVFNKVADEWLSVLTIKINGMPGLEKALDIYKELKDKVVTITIKTVNKGGSSPDEPGGDEPFYSTDGSGGEGYDVDGGGQRLGGLIAMLARGGRLPGFGGGDKVNAKLEKGEFVIRKEAVNKYGEGLFNALNTMAFRIGGMVRGMSLPPMPKPRYAFATGGPVEQPTVSAPSMGGNTFVFNYAPTISTASKSEMRKAAEQFDKFIKEKQRRRG